MKKSLKPSKRLLSIVVSIGILVGLSRYIAFNELYTVLRNVRIPFLLASILMMLPIIAVTAFRFKWLVPSKTALTMPTACQMTLVANLLNIFLPAKLGDFYKSYKLMKSNVTPGISIGLIVFERACDLLGLLTFGLLGWALYHAQLTYIPPALFVGLLAVFIVAFLCVCLPKTSRVAGGMLQYCLPMRFRIKVARKTEDWIMFHEVLSTKVIAAVGISLVLWGLHLTQIWLLVASINVDLPFLLVCCLSALVLLASMMPLTFLGIGVRDAAFVYFFSDFMSREAALAVAILATSRMFIPALLALPYVPHHLPKNSIQRLKARNWFAEKPADAQG